MKAVCPFLIVLAVLVVLVSAVFLYYPVHDFFGLQNTVYSASFTGERYARVAIGTARHQHR